MNDLFGPTPAPPAPVIEIAASGPVPREFYRGLAWTAEHEALFETRVRAGLATMPMERARQEARWSVELEMDRRLHREQMERVDRCGLSREAKRALFGDWVSRFGGDMADRLALMAATPELRAAVRRW